MKSLLRNFLLACTALYTVACVEITEDITLNANNSGTMAWTLDMSGMIALMQSFGGGGAELKESGEKMDSTFTSMHAKLEAIDGISNVRHESDKSGLKFTVKYDFASPQALNAALAAQKEESEKEKSANKDLLLVSKKKIERKLQLPAMQSTAEMEKMTDSDIEMAKMFMEGANYVYIIRLPKAAKKVSNPYSRMIDDNKTVMTIIPLVDYLEKRGKLDISNTISF